MNKAKEINEQMKKSGKQGFYMHSPAGHGKTYIMKQFYNAKKTRTMKLADGREVEVSGGARMESMGDIFDKLQGAMKEDKYQSELRAIQELKYLFLDDLGIEKHSDFREEVMYKIIDYRYRNDLPISFTSNLKLGEIAEKYSPRIASRIAEMCLIVELEGEDRRLQTVEKMKI